MMRINQEEEHYIGRVRPAFHGRVKIGFAKDGRITALDLYWLADNGPYEQQHDCGTGARMASLIYQPPAMRFRGMSMVTNTNPTGSQSQPGGMNAVAIIEPVLSKAARQLGIDQVQMRRINAPEGQAPVGPAGANGRRGTVTSAFVKEALNRGAELFDWEGRKARPKERVGSKVRGIGVAVSPYIAGSVGFDGLFVIKPDGRLAIQSGVGNLGTHSVIDVHRVVAEILDVPWEKCDITWGNTAKHLPWTCISGGSQTIHAMTRAAHAAAMDAKTKLQEIAAKDLGGSPSDYDVANERVFRKGGGRGMSLADAAKRAIALGGKYDGHEVPKDVNPFTKASAAALAGQGLMAVARDAYPRNGQTHSYVASFAEVEVDVETGQYVITDFLAVVDVGTVINPRSLGGQVLGRSMLGISHTIGQNRVRPALRRAAGDALLPEPPAVDSRCAAAHALGGAEHPGSRDAGRRARHRRAAGRQRVRVDSQRALGCARRQRVPPRASDAGHDPDVARRGASRNRGVDSSYIGEGARTGLLRVFESSWLHFDESRYMSKYLIVFSLVIAALTIEHTPGLRAAGGPPSLAPRASASQGPAAAQPARPLLQQYCVTCHNDRLKTGELDPDRRRRDQRAAACRGAREGRPQAAERQMPPEGRRGPTPRRSTRSSPRSKRALDRRRGRGSQSRPGRLAPAEPRPSTSTSSTICWRSTSTAPSCCRATWPGSASTTTPTCCRSRPALMSRYIAAATKISRLAVASPDNRPITQVYKVGFENAQDARMGEDLPFATHGGLAVRHAFPLDGEYVFTLRLKRNGTVSTIDGIEEDEHEIELRIDHALVKRFTIGGKFKGPDPGVLIAVPEDDVEGQKLHDYRMNADKELEVRVPIKAGTRLVSAAFTDTAPAPSSERRSRGRSVWRERRQLAGRRHALHLRAVRRQGREDTPSRRRIFTCRPAAQSQRRGACARKISPRWRGAPTAGR